MLSPGDLPGISSEELTRINKQLSSFGGNPTAVSERRRFAEGEYKGNLVIFDHERTPPRPLALGTEAGYKEYLPKVACILNCWDFMMRGMETSGLEEQHHQAIGELPIPLGLAILELEDDRTVFPLPMRQLA